MALRHPILAAILPLGVALAGCAGDPDAAPPVGQTVVTGEDAPHALFADVDGVYWATGDGAVRMLDVGHSEPRDLAVGQGEVVSLVADETRVYWMVGGDDGAMRHVNKAGNADPDEVVAGLASPRGIGMDESCIFWVTDDAVMAVWKDGGELITVAADSPAPADVEVDFSGIYWIDGTEGGSVWQLDVVGQAPRVIARAPGARRLALDPGRIFWTTSTGGVASLEKGGDTPGLLTETEVGLGALTAIAGTPYWIAADGAEVRTYDADSGSATAVAVDQAGAVDIAAVEGFIYWVNAGDGRVARVGW
jgi:hypothetical protein